MRALTEREKLIQSIRKGIGGSLPRYMVERVVPKMADALIADGVIVSKLQSSKEMQ